MDTFVGIGLVNLLSKFIDKKRRQLDGVGGSLFEPAAKS